MPLKLMYITNDERVAAIAQKSGVDRIWIDLERRGKEERQHGLNTVKSKHVIEDVSRLRNVVSISELLVRVNPLHGDSKQEIDEVIARGADIVMLPMFRTTDEASRFVDMVGGRAKVLLLAETIGAENDIEDITRLPGVDEIHIGLNDLHLERKQKFMFELLADGTVDKMCAIMRRAGMEYGFGGIARLDEGKLPARHIIAEHYRLGSHMAILSRSFYDSWLNDEYEEIERVFHYGITEIREFERRLEGKPEDFFTKNHEDVKREVAEIVKGTR